MALQKSPKKLAKLLDYILGRRPDEFGLVTDSDGFIKIKEVLKALSEEEGLTYVRRAHLDEILITLPDPLIEIADNSIRAKKQAAFTRAHLCCRSSQAALSLCAPKSVPPCICQRHKSHRIFPSHFTDQSRFGPTHGKTNRSIRRPADGASAALPGQGGRLL